MKWTIRIELTPDGNPPLTYEVSTFNRPMSDLTPEQIGLTLEEGNQILRRLQLQIITAQHTPMRFAEELAYTAASQNA